MDNFEQGIYASPEDYLNGLTSEQLAVIRSDSRKLFVSAGPGSGKTRVLTTRIFFRLLKPLIENHFGQGKPKFTPTGGFPHIHVITFTNKAAQELKQRLGMLSNGAIAAAQTSGSSSSNIERLQKIILKRQMYIGTFHSLCYQLLLRFAPKFMDVGQLSILDVSDSKQLVRLVMDQLKREANSDRFGFSADTIKFFNVNVFLSAVNEHKQSFRLKSDSRLSLSNPWKLYTVDHFTGVAQRKLVPSGNKAAGRETLSRMYTEVYRRYTSMMKAAKQLDFDDLLHWAILLLRSMPSLASDQYDKDSKHRLLVSELYVDEFQDTNSLQLEFLSALQQFCSQTSSKPLSITLVGDPDQTIFSWRNFKPTESSESFNTCLFGSSSAPTPENGWEVRFLTANFRSPPTITRAAGSVITFDSSRDTRTKTSSIPKSSEASCGGPHIILRELHSFHCEHEYIAKEIQRLKASAESIGAPFHYRDNPIHWPRGAGLWDSKVGRDLLAYLRLLRNPSDLTSLLRAVNVPPRKVGSVTFQKITNFAGSSTLPALDGLLQLINGPKPQASTDEAKLYSVSGLKTFCSDIRKIRESFDAPGCTLSSLLETILEVTDYMAHLPPPTEDDQENTPASQVMTLKEIVYKIQASEAHTEDPDDLPILNDVDCLLESAGLGHSVDDTGSTTTSPDAVRISTLHSSKGLEWPIVFIASTNQIPHFRCNTKEAINEEARLLYVGVTRCQYQLYITWYFESDFNSASSNHQSPFLSNIPESISSGSAPKLDVAFWTRFVSAVHRDFEAPDNDILLDSSGPASPKRLKKDHVSSQTSFVSAVSLLNRPSKSFGSASMQSALTKPTGFVSAATLLRKPTARFKSSKMSISNDVINVEHVPNLDPLSQKLDCTGSKVGSDLHTSKNSGLAYGKSVGGFVPAASLRKPAQPEKAKKPRCFFGSEGQASKSKKSIVAKSKSIPVQASADKQGSPSEDSDEPIIIEL
ncbi:hypothetical protein DSO57_1013542 [Entomophthora muscae]|uniref:Uncharacterized protein n=1 Tax=Entomophthora muscae TaxID=34485 RepID=A0ACC2US15_9FUNG|nr:hypothetical protein DSO57_1013542 [Entomophthora muscae]